MYITLFTQLRRSLRMVGDWTDVAVMQPFFLIWHASHNPCPFTISQAE